MAFFQFLEARSGNRDSFDHRSGRGVGVCPGSRGWGIRCRGVFGFFENVEDGPDDLYADVDLGTRQMLLRGRRVDDAEPGVDEHASVL